MTILFCNCSNEKACDMHADELYNPETTVNNSHVEPTFRDILNKMLEDAKVDVPLRNALHTLYGESVFQDSADPEIRELARIDSREMYRED